MVAAQTTCLCLACKYLRPASARGLTCAAFPEGIPAWIFEGAANHRYPFPGDRGIRFEPAPDAPASVLARLEELHP